MVSPLAVALLTAFKEQEKDYNWYIHINRKEAILLNEVKQLWEAFIMDRQGDSPQIMVYFNKNRIALLIGHMMSTRKDFVKRIISDTFYLEFEAQHSIAVLSAAAALLNSYDANSVQYKQNEDIFLQYAEDLVNKFQEGMLEDMPQGINLPILEKRPLEKAEAEKLPTSVEVAVRSTPDSRKGCASYLSQLAQLVEMNSSKVPTSVLVVSTGRVDKDDIQKYADNHTGGHLVILTLSDSVQGEEDLRQRFEGLSELAKKHIPKVPEPLKKWFGIGLMFFILGSGSWFFTLDRIPPQLTSLTLQMANRQTLALTFTEAVHADYPPHVKMRIEAETGEQKAPCQTTDQQHWECPMSFTVADSRQKTLMTLDIQDARDRAENIMQPVTVTLAIEKTDIIKPDISCFLQRILSFVSTIFSIEKFIDDTSSILFDVSSFVSTIFSIEGTGAIKPPY